MIVEDIYSYAKTLVDGDEFDSEDEALAIANVADKNIRSERNWPFDMRTATITDSFASITDLGKITAVRDTYGEPLKVASFNNRYNTDYDVWIDLANQKIEPINDTFTGYIIDYKIKPVALDWDDEPVYDADFHPLLAYEMVLARLEADQTTDFYNQHGAKYEKMKNRMVLHYETYNL